MGGGSPAHRDLEGVGGRFCFFWEIGGLRLVVGLCTWFTVEPVTWGPSGRWSVKHWQYHGTLDPTQWCRKIVIGRKE